jgi:hypothetical protein
MDILSGNGKIYAIGDWNPAFAPKTLSFVEEYTPDRASSNA